MSGLPSLGPRGEGWVLIQLILFAAIAAVGVWAPRTVEGASGGFLMAAGGAAVVLGGVLAGAGLAGLRRGSALTALPHPRAEAELVTNGVYRLVRHPVYGGLVLAAFGWAILRASPATALAAAGLLVFFDLKRRREEAWLSARFAGYAAYRSRTRRLIPWLY